MAKNPTPPSLRPARRLLLAPSPGTPPAPLYLMENNISTPERLASVMAGAAIMTYGLSRRSVGGLLTAALGGALVVRGGSGYCPAYGALDLSTAPQKHDNVSVPYGRGIRVEDRVVVNASPEHLYRYWRNFANLPRFMRSLESVRVLDDRRSHWVVKGPAGRNVEWDAEVINEIPNELIGWRSVNSPEVDHAGSVHFLPLGTRTEVHVLLRYDPPGGALGAMVAKLFGEEPQRQIHDDLRRFKVLIEHVGEPRIAEDRATASPA